MSVAVDGATMQKKRIVRRDTANTNTFNRWDETHNRYFYANTVTGQTQWELPTQPAVPGGGEANAYQGAPPEYSQNDPTQSPSSSSDRGLGSFMSSAMGGGRPQNGYGNQYQSGYGGGYPNNGGYSHSGNSGMYLTV